MTATETAPPAFVKVKVPTMTQGEWKAKRAAFDAIRLTPDHTFRRKITDKLIAAVGADPGGLIQTSVRVAGLLLRNKLLTRPTWMVMATPTLSYFTTEDLMDALGAINARTEALVDPSDCPF